MASIKQRSVGETVGIWAESNVGSVGIIAQDNVGAYFQIRSKPDSVLPEIAIGINKGGLFLQTKSGKTHDLGALINKLTELE